MFLSFVNYFPILCFPDTHFLIREGPNITPYAMDLMVHAKKILGHEGRCVYRATCFCDTSKRTNHSLWTFRKFNKQLQCRFFETFPWLSRTFLLARWNHKHTNINIFHCPTPWIWDVPITDNVPLRLRVFPISIEIYCSSISCNIRWKSELICKT